MIKITGVLVDILAQLSPKVYGPYVVFENGQKVLYVQVLKVIYGMLQDALLWNMKFRKDLEKQGFKSNPNDPCVANQNFNGSQYTILFHVDDLKCSHRKKTLNDDSAKWLEKIYGKHRKVKIHHGKVHDYLGMKLDYSEKKTVKIDMRDYVKGMFDSYPIIFKRR